MLSPERYAERLTALFFLGVVLFNPLVLGIFDAGADSGILGVPTLYLYLFTAWAALIGLLALATRHLTEDSEPPPTLETPETDLGETGD